MKFAVGDKVAHIDSTDEGIVREIKGEELRVEDEFGFDTWYHEKELVQRGSLQIGRVEQKDALPKPSHQSGQKRIEKHELIKDLHFNQLVDFPKNFSNFQMLEIQLREARKALETARRSGIKRVILIHGIGEGRLREEVHSMLERMDRLQFYDASYDQFGSGATEVELL